MITLSSVTFFCHVPMYIHRTLEPVLQKAAKEFPVVILTGPRQSGKTTLLKYLFAQQYRYVSMEPPDVRTAAITDPRSFMKLWKPPLLIDEIQFAPELLFYIKEAVDGERGKAGQFILTGSQNLLLMQQITETLAGRAAILQLLPLTLNEAWNTPTIHFPWDQDPRLTDRTLSYTNFWKSVVRGSFPELVANPRRDARLWQSSYMQTYLERDVRLLRQVGDLSQFQIFMKLLAARSAQLLNLSELARDLGVAVNTIKVWISILESSYQVVLLRPYFANITKRLVKMPKIYFLDVGLLCYLMGIEEPKQIMDTPLGGPVFETLVVSEIVKAYFHQGKQPPIHFWRTASGSEVDILVEYQQQLIAIEVKLCATPNPRMATQLLELKRWLGDKVKLGLVIHPGDIQLPISDGILALPISRLL